MTDRLLSFDAPLERLKDLHPKRIDLTLERMLRVCGALGRPQDKLPPVVHVAGTNGKGSTLAFLRAMAEAQGLRVHVYTSPHLVRFAERIRLSGVLITDDYLADVLDRVEQANAGAPLTFFEATTTAAFLAFSETPADILLLETGLGGILDATNIVDEPLLSLITPIDYDHQGFLGDDLTTIAKQKAGIIKPNVPVLSARQQDEARAVLVRQAMRMHAPLSFLGEDFSAHMENNRLILQDESALYDLPPPALYGPHQVENAGLAVKAALKLGWSEAAIEAGLQNAVWPGRLQRLRAGPLHDALPKGSELWLDGGHNPHAAKALATFLRHSALPIHLICGLINTKDAGAFFAAFEGLSLDVTCIPFSSDAAIPADELVYSARLHGLNAKTADSPLSAVRALPDTPCRVVICGSLYLAGDVLALSPDTFPI